MKSFSFICIKWAFRRFTSDVGVQCRPTHTKKKYKLSVKVQHFGKQHYYSILKFNVKCLMAGNIHSIIRKWSITQIVRNVSVTKPDMAINCLPTKSTDNCSLFHFKRSVIYQEWGMQIKIKSVYSYFIY